jgi:LysM repeat protein
LSCSLFAQDKNFTKHTVSKGETIKQIATKYKVTPFDIYKLNPDSQDGVAENDILLIPVQKVEQVTPPAETVLSKPKNTYTTSKRILPNPKKHFIVFLEITMLMLKI